MAEPASAPFPPSDNRILLLRELQSHVEKFSKHLQSALENHLLAQQTVFLREFSDNLVSLNTLMKSISMQDMDPDLRKSLAENLDILNFALNLSIESDKSTIPLLLLEAIKNYETPTPLESDLGKFMAYIGKYPESIRVLIQELNLISEEFLHYL